MLAGRTTADGRPAGAFERSMPAAASDAESVRAPGGVVVGGDDGGEVIPRDWPSPARRVQEGSVMDNDAVR